MIDLSGKPEAPRVPRPEERPLSAEETAGLAMGDPFGEHGQPDARHENAAGKMLCGMCAWKVKNKWECAWRRSGPCPKEKAECVGFSQKPLRKKGAQGGKKKGLPVPEGVKFLYIGRPRHKTPAMEALDRAFGPRLEQVFGPQNADYGDHKGVVTVAWITPAPGVLHLGFSFCSPEDPWCKAKGRDMAAARLRWLMMTVPFLYDAKRTVYEVARAILSHDFDLLKPLCLAIADWGHSRVPSWTKGLVRRVKLVKLFEVNLPGFDVFKSPPPSKSSPG